MIGADDPLRGSLISEADRFDIGLIVTVPLVLVSIYLLPEATRESLAFVYADPSPVAALIAPYVHLTLSHLLSNLVVYLLIVPLAFIIDLVTGNRGRFRSAFLVLTLVVAPAVSVLNLAVARPGSTIGFSVVALGFAGYLALAIGDYVRTVFLPRADWDVGAICYLLGLAIVVLLTDLRPVTYLAAFSAVALSLAFLVGVFRVHPPSIDGVTAAVRHERFDLLAIALVVYFSVPVVAFGPDPVLNGVIINVYGHLVGFALGFLVPYIYVYVASAAVSTG